MSVELINQLFVASEILLFNILGLFGNINIICLTIYNPNLRSKSCIRLHRSTCFPAISTYIFFICAQAVIMLMLVIDLFIIVFFTTFYRKMDNLQYTILMLLPPFVYATFTVTWGFLTMDDEIVIFCNPPLSLHPTVSRFWGVSNIVMNTITLSLFLFLMAIFHFKGKKQKSDTRKLMKRLKVSVIVFIFSWYMCTLGVDLFVMLAFLQSILCFTHIMCLICTMVDVALAFPDIQLLRYQCYPWVAPGVFFEGAQSLLICFLVLDILIIVKLPHRYRNTPNWLYILRMLIPPIIFGAIFTYWGFTNLDKTLLYFCNPTIGLHPTASTNFTRCNVIINTLTVAIFITLIIIFHNKKTSQTDSRKVMKRLQISVVIFMCSWYLNLFLSYLFINVEEDEENLNFMINNMSFLALIAYSQSFYIVLWKSIEYRKCFFQLFHLNQAYLKTKTSPDMTKFSQPTHVSIVPINI